MLLVLLAWVAWDGAEPQGPFVVACVRAVPNGCGPGQVVRLAGPEGAWFPDLAAAEQAAASAPDCPLVQ